MAYITNNFEVIKKKTGLDIPNVLLYAHMNLDAKHSTTPLFIEKGDDRFLLVKDIEKGNFDEGSVSAEVKYYNNYLTFDSNYTVLPPDWLELCEEIVGDDAVEIDDDIHASAYWKLSSAFTSVLKKTGDWARIYIYETEREDVKRVFAAGNKAGYLDALKFIPYLKQGKDIAELLNQPDVDSRFALLDGFIRDQGTEALLISSPLNIQEVTGLPYEYCCLNDLLVIYNPDGLIQVLSNRPIDYAWFRLREICRNTGEMSGRFDICQYNAVGIEEDHLPYKYFHVLGLKREKVSGMGGVLRRWREIRASEDLSFYLIAARTTIEGIDAALEFAQEKFDKCEALTETDVQKRLYEYYGQCSINNDLRVRIIPYFIVLHAGHRTRRPNFPSFDLLSKHETKTLKLDTGVLIVDQNGLIRACSDLCRTLAPAPEAEELYRYLDKVMIEDAIPAAVPGKTGEDVYNAGVSALISNDDQRWIDNGLLPQKGLEGKFERNIGHVLGKQEPANLGIAKGNQVVFEPGMVCCVEYQWPYDQYAIGVEDMFAVTRKGPFNLTR